MSREGFICLFNISFSNIKGKKSIVNNNINSRYSMPFKQKAKKIVKNILDMENNKASYKLKLNKSYCFLTCAK